MRVEVDVLVVGLGPAGAAAALAAAQAGLRVAAVECRKEIGVPVQCAEFIPLPLARYAVPEGVSQQRIRGMTSHLPSGWVEKSDAPGLMIDRAAFDQALARQAGQSGARLYLNSRLTGLDGAGSSAIVLTPQGEIYFDYRLLIAADGPHSFVARSLGLPRQETVHTRQYTVPLPEVAENTEIWLSPDYPGGYAWLFPKGRVANLGLGVDKRFAADTKAALDALHLKLVVEGRVGADILYRTGGSIPVSGLRQNLVVGNVLFVGDAAGLTHPITGAGIAAAVVSGELAGQAAADRLMGHEDNALMNYENTVREQFSASLERALVRRAGLGKCWGRPAASEDRVQRRGWVAFPEYYEEP
ncbi:geranylgeranyl reductase [Sulfuricella denitrificans skB26]|uniref:Geranylgeranyl reductase n=1 Tax=Sulfuricella denitrificans (strain DSM 22764 / NBRC 105220 / skB26) TaxID=1163617 RepID=S6A9T0_SULDS|nr:NAD(P)/FAD-dependent oxidoreductase [Sulfuricella denitrificans]BAN34645.1 geranylgeranyl reductase [Sulfuricella denitrificans skB26]